jgi:hypothetical protein
MSSTTGLFGVIEYKRSIVRIPLGQLVLDPLPGLALQGEDPGRVDGPGAVAVGMARAVSTVAGSPVRDRAQAAA